MKIRVPINKPTIKKPMSKIDKIGIFLSSSNPLELLTPNIAEVTAIND